MMVEQFGLAMIPLCFKISSGLTSGVWIGALLAQLSVGDTPLFDVDSYHPKNYIQKLI